MYKINNTLLALLAASLLCCVSAFAADAPAAGSTAKPAAAAPASEAKAAAAKAEVSKAQFTTAVNDRAPADDVTTLDNSHAKVFFYQVLDNMSGQTVTDRWSYNGNTVAEVKLSPKAARWRTWSSKNLDPAMTGTWKVEVVDDAGNVLATKTFDYTKAETSAAPAAATK